MDERSAYLQISETGSKRLPPCPHVGGLWRDLFRPLQGLPHGGAGKENHFAHASLLVGKGVCFELRQSGRERPP